MNKTPQDGAAPGTGSENRRHFLVDINTVFGLFGKRYFLIFYFGRHLHPRQRTQLVNQRMVGNWMVIAFGILMLAGFVYAAVQMVAWRTGTDTHAPAGVGSFTERQLAPAPNRA